MTTEHRDHMTASGSAPSVTWRAYLGRTEGEARFLDRILAWRWRGIVTLHRWRIRVAQWLRIVTFWIEPTSMRRGRAGRVLEPTFAAARAALARTERGEGWDDSGALCGKQEP